jgi:hypothetical protein
MIADHFLYLKIGEQEYFVDDLLCEANRLVSISSQVMGGALQLCG